MLNVAGVALLGPLLLAGCGRAAGPSSVGPSTEVPPLTVSSSAAVSLSARTEADQQAVTAYAGMLRTWADAAKTANPEAAALRQYAQGDALKSLVNRLYGMQAKHIVGLGEPGTSPSAVDARPIDVPTTVIVRDCLDNATWLQYKESGELWDDKPGQRYVLEAVVVKADGLWKVDDFAIQDLTC